METKIELTGPKSFDLRSKISGCSKCEIAKTRMNILCGKGNIPADIMIISDSPTIAEDKFGEFLTGPEGDVLRDVLLNSGMLESDTSGKRKYSIYITSLIKCTPRTDDDPDKKPSKKEITNCSDYFKYEIENVKPKVIITLGDNTAKTMVENRSIKIAASHGGSFHSKKFNCTVVPTFSPSSVVKTPSLRILMVHDFKKVVSLFNSVVEAGIGLDYKVLNTDAEVEEVINDIKENHDSFAFDIETNQETEESDLDIVCFTLSPEVGKAYLVPIMDEYYQPTSIDWKKHLKNLFSLDKLVIAQNGKFDIKVLKQYDIKVTNFNFDTMLAHSLIDENMSHKLKDLSVVYTDMGHYSDGIELFKLNNKVNMNYRKIPNNILYPYAMKDSDCTYRLYVLFSKLLKEMNLDKLFYKVTMPLQNVLLETEYRGVSIDEEYLEKLELDFTSELKDCQGRIFKSVGHDFNVSSIKQLRTVLFDELKLKPIEWTKTGPSTDVNTLEKLAKSNVIVKDILKYRELDKLIGTYIIGLKERIKSGLIHTEYNIAVARTGRLTSKNPNLQNISTDPKILNLFISRPGRTFIYGDYDQMEFKLLGHYCDDLNMIEGINRGEDVHTLIASMVFDVEYNEVSKDQRDKAKTLNYSIIYGAGPNNVADQLGISIFEAKDLIRRFYDIFPTIREWMKRTLMFAKAKGYVLDSFGRRRNLPHINSTLRELRGDAERAAINSPVQGLSADLVNFAVVRIEPLVQKFDTYLSLHVHDSLTYEAPDEYVNQLLPLVKAEMERKIPGIKVNLTASMKTGKTWGNLKEWEGK